MDFSLKRSEVVLSEFKLLGQIQAVHAQRSGEVLEASVLTTYDPNC
jgi:hypothetical protein